jgi:hypothetical protein
VPSTVGETPAPPASLDPGTLPDQIFRNIGRIE